MNFKFSVIKKMIIFNAITNVIKINKNKTLKIKLIFL